MRVILVGCGRMGSTLANRLAQDGHAVTVIDVTATAFHNLASDFRGRTVEAEVLGRDVLVNAGVEQCDCLATLTNSDTVNAVVGHMATAIFHVPRVVVRNYDPRWLPLHQSFGLRAVSSVTWNADQFMNMLMEGNPRPAYPLAEELNLYEQYVPERAAGRRLGIVTAGLPVVVAALIRQGQGILPEPEVELKSGDLLMVSAAPASIEHLRARLEARG